MRLSRKNLIATLVGVMLAGVPMAVFNFWLDGLIERQGQEEVAISARRAMTLAEFRLARVARRVIASLQGIGVRVAIDDVGTGHNGLSYILKLGADIIKIDKMFVDSVSSWRNSATIVETLVDLARNLRMEIIAEGVENFDQVIALRDRGIHAAQSFVFAPPLHGALFLKLLEAIDPQQDVAVERDSAPLRLAAALS